MQFSSSWFHVTCVCRHLLPSGEPFSSCLMSSFCSWFLCRAAMSSPWFSIIWVTSQTTLTSDQKPLAVAGVVKHTRGPTISTFSCRSIFSWSLSAASADCSSSTSTHL